MIVAPHFVITVTKIAGLRDRPVMALSVEAVRTRENLTQASATFSLTARETEILSLVLDGASTLEVASLLHLADTTVHGYFKRLLGKTASRNRSAMIAKVLGWRPQNDLEESSPLRGVRATPLFLGWRARPAARYNGRDLKWLDRMNARNACTALILSMLLALGTGVTATSADAPLASSVQAGDKVMVHVYNHPDLSGPQTVDSSGNLTLPLVGVVPVAGTDPSTAAGRIRTALTAYVRFPAVDLQLISQNDSIFVSGGPGGTLKYSPGESLASVLASLPATDGADISHGRVDLKTVRIRRGTQELGPFDMTHLSASGEAGPALQPGDTVALQNKPVAVAVRGSVKTPGTAYLATDEPLGDAIVQTGGLSPDAATGHIALQRGGAVRYLTVGDTVMQQPAKADDTLTIAPAMHVTVTGAVATAGNAVLKTDFSLISALYSAGGPQKNADLNAVHVVHDGKQTTYNLTAVLHGDTSQNPTLTEGDLVAVPEGRKRLDVAGIFQSLLSGLWLLK